MDILKILDMYGQEKKGGTPKTPSKTIHEYSKSNDVDNIKELLLDLNNKDKILHSKDEYGATALHYAAKNGYNDLLVYLSSENNNNFTDVDNSGFTPLHCAAGFGHSDVVNSILSKIDDDINQINAIDKSGSTALHYACYYDHIPVALILVDHGASPYIKNNNGKSSLDMIKDWISKESLEHHVSVYNDRKANENKTSRDSNDLSNTTTSSNTSNDNNNDTSNDTSNKVKTNIFDTKDIPIEVYVAIIVAMISYFLLK